MNKCGGSGEGRNSLVRDDTCFVPRVEKSSDKRNKGRKANQQRGTAVNKVGSVP